MNEHYGNEVLIFSIDSKRYALELRYVVETVQSLPVTRVPRLPSFIRGIANLRAISDHACLCNTGISGYRRAGKRERILIVNPAIATLR